MWRRFPYKEFWQENDRSSSTNAVAVK